MNFAYFVAEAFSRVSSMLSIVFDKLNIEEVP